MGANSTRNRKRLLQESLKASLPENMVHPEERLLPAEFREKLRRNGLVGGALPLFVSTHASYPSGYSISLPESNGGNTLYDHEAYTRDDEGHDQLTRMPSLKLWGEAGNWNICVSEWVPGPGPGDFTKRHMSLDEVLQSILGYFFDPNNEYFNQAELAY
ncbi:hypothetical protein ACU8L2_23490 [Rhizobium leguminosarum]